MDPGDLNDELVRLVEDYRGVSDINFTVGKPPQVEVHGELREVSSSLHGDCLTCEDTEEIVDAILFEQPRLHEELDRTGSVDCGYMTDDGHRFRANLFRCRGHLSVVLRVLSAGVPTLEGLGLPPILAEIPALRDGLVLVTGATGSGKSTTQAAIIDRVNSTRAAHIVTLEDPIEFLHQHRMGTVNQRELGIDFLRFTDGLRDVLRQAPKVIQIGEMRDRETVEIGIKAAETGQLVLSTLHTVDAGRSIERIAGMFPNEERSLVRVRLAQVLRFVVAQRLLPAARGGRVAAMEVMGSSMRVRELIEHGEGENKTFRGVIEDAQAHGWQTFDQHILEMYRTGAITAETARAFCTDVAEVNRGLDRIRASAGQETSSLGELEMEYTRKQKR